MAKDSSGGLDRCLAGLHNAELEILGSSYEWCPVPIRSMKESDICSEKIDHDYLEYFHANCERVPCRATLNISFDGDNQK